jgi:hypothetical protein
LSAEVQPEFDKTKSNHRRQEYKVEWFADWHPYLSGMSVAGLIPQPAN